MAKKQPILQTALFEFDAQVRTHAALFCGVDEAGRGPLAGDVYAAAVILQPDALIAGLNDSKKITEARREDMVPEIKEKALAWAIASATVEEIERMNILQAAMLAMQRAVEQLSVAPALALIDGNRAPVLQIPVQTLIGGDAKSASIAAASVLAKTARDASLRELDEQCRTLMLENERLTAEYESLASIDKVEKYAVSVLGMQQCEATQIVYIEMKEQVG